MRINGAWRRCDDNSVRPTTWGEVQDARGHWLEVLFLADSGADRTVFSIDVFDLLGFLRIQGVDRVAGIGGSADAFEFPSILRMRRMDGTPVSFRGEFAAVAAASVLDMSVLGRDITNLLTLVVDRPGDTVCLLSRGEVYQA